ncbi:MAG: hypothetical protein KKD64_11465 [Alphaproteobacteria bacterium]|nr:hypothetical protein [Alphaproteobacteria bacterium]MBU0877391.1 hypothetical protein [Alphaproteobacteria bacterium]MBU1770258.1 hypothetical protein [Alphaproteobacteria bacterium]
MAKTVDTLLITRTADTYMLQIEDEDGETFEFDITYDQLELISEDIERHLDEDEEDALAVESDDDEVDDGEVEA